MARAARRFPLVLEMLRSSAVHLSGLRVLVPHLNDETCEALLAQAAGKSKRAIEELVAGLAPRPSVPDSIRKVPAPRDAGPALAPAPVAPAPPAAQPVSSTAPELLLASPPAPPKPALVSPLSPDRYHVQLTASRELRDKIDEARALLRHQVPTGDLATILDRALTVLIAEVKKQRFGVGRKPRSGALREGPAGSRHVPDAIRRAVYERDGGQCTYVSDSGHRCEERGFLELDHVEGFARRREHSVAGLRLRCRAHNQHAATVMYGPELMARRRRERAQGTARSTRPGAT